MPRFFIAAANIFGGVAYMDAEAAGHIKVLRIRKGETFTVCDGAGKDYDCRLVKSGEDGAEAEIVAVRPSGGEASVDCSVYAAFPKGDKAETVIQKSVELGANRVLFFPSARCVARPEGAALIKKLERWNKIALEAAKQCGRGAVPEVLALRSFGETVKSASRAELPLFFYEADTDYTVKQALRSRESFASASLMTGAEGGFEAEEVEEARAGGMLVTSLGKRILRCETAPAAALAALMYETDNF